MKRGVVGGRVKEIRDRLEWSQDELCARLKDCGYPVLQPNLSLMEQGKRKIDADAIPCFAEVLGVDPNDLYGFKKSSLTEVEESPRGQEAAPLTASTGQRIARRALERLLDIPDEDLDAFTRVVEQLRQIHTTE